MRNYSNQKDNMQVWWEHLKTASMFSEQLKGQFSKNKDVSSRPHSGALSW